MHLLCNSIEENEFLSFLYLPTNGTPADVELSFHVCSSCRQFPSGSSVYLIDGRRRVEQKQFPPPSKLTLYCFAFHLLCSAIISRWMVEVELFHNRGFHWLIALCCTTIYTPSLLLHKQSKITSDNPHTATNKVAIMNGNLFPTTHTPLLVSRLTYQLTTQHSSLFLPFQSNNFRQRVR